MSEKEREIWIQKITKIVIATISLIVLIISLWIIVDCFKVPADRTNLILNYNSSSDIDYKVYLKENRFYDQKFLGKDKKYLSGIIDYIDVNLNYAFSATRKISSSYSYSVDAFINSDYELNGKAAELWSKKYSLVPIKKETKDNTYNFKIQEKLKIDYSKYDAMAKKFREEYGVASDTKLTIVINISSTSNVRDYKKSINDNKTIRLVIPLNKVVTDVTVSGNTPTKNNVTEVVKGERVINYPLLIIAAVMFVISTPICAITFYKLFKITNVSQYMVQLRRILKSYGDIIAEVTTKPDLRGLNIIEVKEFDDLINIEEELRVPILYYELERDNEAWFIITTGNQVYRFILKASTHMKF